MKKHSTYNFMKNAIVLTVIKNHRYVLILLFACFLSFNVFLWSETKETERSIPANSTSLDIAKRIITNDSKIEESQVKAEARIKTATEGFLILPAKDFCKPGTKLVFVIKSKVDNFEFRRQIRLGWGRDMLNDTWVKMAFLVANPGLHAQNVTELLHNESQTYNDIVQGSFIESYKNLTKKSVMALKWFSLHCRHAEYMMSVDDDFQVNKTKLSSIFFNETIPSTSMKVLNCGKISKNATVRRIGKWTVPYSVYPDYNYPDYCYGFCYMMSRDVAVELYLTSVRTEIKLEIDDVVVTGILRSKSPLQVSLGELPPRTCLCQENSAGKKTCGGSYEGKERDFNITLKQMEKWSKLNNN